MKYRLANHNHLSEDCYAERKKVEYIEFDSQDDMDLAERYFIMKFKPKYNTTFSRKCLTLNLSDLDNIEWKHLKTKKEIEREQEEKCEKYFKESLERKIIFSQTNEIFNNAKEVYEKYNIPLLEIYANLEKLECQRFFEHPKYRDTIFMYYYDEYIKNAVNIEHLKEIHIKENMKPVICLTTGEIFINLSEVEKKYNLYKGNIIQCCEQKKNYCGSINNLPLIWIWFEDYQKKEHFEIQQRINKSIEVYLYKNKEIRNKFRRGDIWYGNPM